MNPYRYGAAWGYVTDTPGSGLLQLGARFYRPEIGRFIQQDPIGEGMNWYAYAGNNPVTRVDPEGLFFSWEDPARPSGAVRTLQKANNFSAGLGDKVSFGLTGWLRRKGGTDYLVDPCSGWYEGGQWTGVGLLTAASAAGAIEAAGARAATAELVEEGSAASLDDLTAAAEELYPNKAGLWESHHVWPKYLGGAANGETVPLNAAHHQLLTNEFRNAWAYGQGAPSAERAMEIMAGVYGRLPLP